MRLNIHGSIRAGRYLLAQYENPHAPYHCGQAQAVLEFQRGGRGLVGRFTGFGIRSHKIVTGEVVLRRGAA